MGLYALTLNFGGYEVVELVGQFDITGRHGVGPFQGWASASQ